MARFLRAIALDALQIVSCLLSIDQAMRDRRLSYRYTTVSPPVQAWPPDEIWPGDHLQVQLFDDALVVDRAGATPAPPTVTGDTPARGPTLCFVGPPGVSKTSLGQSIARAADASCGCRSRARGRGRARARAGAVQRHRQHAGDHPAAAARTGMEGLVLSGVRNLEREIATIARKWPAGWPKGRRAVTPEVLRRRGRAHHRPAARSSSWR